VKARTAGATIRRRATIVTGVLALAAAPAGAASRAGAVDALAHDVREALHGAIAISVCSFVPMTTTRLDDALARRPDAASEAVAGYRARLKGAAPKLEAACLAKTREALAASTGPLAELNAAVPRRLAAQLTRDELEQARAAAATPAARKLATLRLDLAQRAAAELGPWALSFVPALGEELRLGLQGEIGAMPVFPAQAQAPAPASPVSAEAAAALPAKIANQSALPGLCASFYPATSRRANEEGSVVLAVHVTVSGRADGVEVVSSSGTPSLDVAAAACVSGFASFVPRREGTQPVPGWQRVKWTWRLEE
jgi:TonB family protein